jgi:protein TonB
MNRYIKSLVLSVALHSLAVIILLILFHSLSCPSRDTVTVDFSSIGYLSSEMNGHPGEGSGSVRKTGSSSGSESGIVDMHHPRTVTSSRKPEKTATRPKRNTTTKTFPETVPVSPEKKYPHMSKPSPGQTVETESTSSQAKEKTVPNDTGKNTGSGTGGGNGNGTEKNTVQNYIFHHYGYIVRHIRQHLVYPEKARRMGITGTTICEFIIMKDGNIKELRLKETSGYASLDEAARQAIKHASPFPKPPVAARIIVPVTFSLK